MKRTLITNDQGRFEAPNLAVGNYDVDAKLTGFGGAGRKGIALVVGRTAVVDLVLRVAQVKEEVVVTGDAPLVEATSATVSQLIDEKKVQDLPVVNRDLTQLLFLLRDPDDSDATKQVQIPADVWDQISAILLHQLLGIPALAKEAERVGIQ